jgi:hypothetical protein
MYNGAMSRKQAPMIQIKVDDPITDRRTLHGHFRPMLNLAEKEALRVKMKVDEAFILFVEKGYEIPDIAKTLEVDPAELTALSISPNFPNFRDAVAERAGKMFLDLEQDYVRDDICRVLGMTKTQLGYFTKSDDFKERYRELWGELTSDPITKAVEVKITESLLPKAYRALDELLEADSESVRLKTAMEVLRYSGIQPKEPEHSDRVELAKFLRQQTTVNIENMTVVVPPEFKEAVNATLPDVVEGEIVEQDP